MNPLLATCPVCNEPLTVTRLHCRNCDTTIEGHFATGVFERLTLEQISFAVTFIRCEGKLNRMEKELGLSYPTLRLRLHELIRAMGFEVGQEEAAPPAPLVSDEERRHILDDLSAGRLTPEEAVRMLQGEN